MKFSRMLVNSNFYVIANLTTSAMLENQRFNMRLLLKEVLIYPYFILVTLGFKGAFYGVITTQNSTAEFHKWL